MKIALIGPGIMKIPTREEMSNTGHGAVERVMAEYRNNLEDLGHEIVIFNNKNIREVSDILNSDNSIDLIHSHYDEHVPLLNHFLHKPFCATTHFGYALRKQYWEGYYPRLYQAALNAPGIVALSSNIADMMINDGANGKVKYLRNGANTKSIRFDKDTISDRAICLGQVSIRKQQGAVSRACGSIHIDFVGPIADNSYSDNGLCKHRGHWKESEVHNNLTNYAALVLVSRGEAAALSCPEALAAGLSLVVSEAASENLDPSKPFISIVSDDMPSRDPAGFAEIVKKAISENKLYRQECRNYAVEHFDWRKIAEEYVEIATEFCNWFHK